MRRLLLFLVVFILAILIGIEMKTNPGAVLIITNHITVETRLWFAVLFLVLLFLVLYFLLCLIKYVFSMPQCWRRWRVKKKTIKASGLTEQGLLAIVTGDWRRAQQQLLQEVKNSPAPLVNYLAAATAANGSGAWLQRDDYLYHASRLMPNTQLAVGLVRARLQYDSGQYTFALVTLQQLLAMSPKQKQLLCLLAKVYQQLGQWRDLVALLPALQKQRIFPKKMFITLAEKAYDHTFAAADDAQELLQLWKKSPQLIRVQVNIIVFYVRALLRLQQDKEAHALISKVLRHHWDEALVLLFADVRLDNSNKQLLQAEHWLKSHFDDPPLLFVLGQLAERNQLWGKAKDYYQASLDTRPDAKVYLAYAKLFERLGDIEKSLVYYRLGLLQTTS